MPVFFEKASAQRATAVFGAPALSILISFSDTDFIPLDCFSRL
jgi:hypothetical protein